MSDSTGAVSTAQDVRDAATAGRTVYVWSDSAATTPFIPVTYYPWFGIRVNGFGTTTTGMVVKISSTGTLETTTGSNLLNECTSNLSPFAVSPTPTPTPTRS